MFKKISQEMLLHIVKIRKFDCIKRDLSDFIVKIPRKVKRHENI